LGWGVRVPARGAPHVDVSLPALTADDLNTELVGAQEREATHTGALKQLYGYNLVARNCVTEIFRVIEAAFARDVLKQEPTLGGADLEARVRAVSERRLGGYMDPGGPLNFIPATSAVSVQSTYAVTDVEEVPSYRRARLARMYAKENPVWVYLRESNTL